jgi:polar amino acid transport system permease protein
MMEGFDIVWQHRGQMLFGFFNTLWLSALGTALALVLGGVLAMSAMARFAPLRSFTQAFVDAMRCVPFLLFAYLIFFGLPYIGIRLGSLTSGLVALVLYNMAYMAEILRAAWLGLPRDSLEAGHIFGFHGVQHFWRIVLPQLVLDVMPVLGNQVIQIIKDSAFLMVIAVPELTHAANSIQAAYYVPFAAFLTAAFFYWLLCLLVESAVGIVGRQAALVR